MNYKQGCLVFGILQLIFFIVAFYKYNKLYLIDIPCLEDEEPICELMEIRPTNKTTIKLAILGDQGVSENAHKVLELIKREKADAIIHSGDHGYQSTPAEWDSMITKYLGDSFPVFSSVGNHDIYNWAEYQELLWKRIKKNPAVFCDGCLGIFSSCNFHHIYLLQVSPGIIPLKSPQNFVNNQFECINKKRNIFQWRICTLHPYSETDPEFGGEDLVNVLRKCKQEGALITSSHAHTYRRFSKDNLENDPKSTRFFLGANSSLQSVAGTGGEELDFLIKGLDHGALFCNFEILPVANPKDDTLKASCYFKTVGGETLDQFVLYTTYENV